MFRGDAIRLRQHLLARVTHDHLPIVTPGLPGDIRRGQALKLPLHLRHGVPGQLLRVGQQDRRGRGSMFRLAQ